MKKRTVRGTLFGTYSIIILSSIFALAVALIAMQAARVRSQTLTALRQQTRSAALNVDREVEQMRTMAMNISYSTRMQDRFFLRPTGSDEGGEAEKLSMMLSLIILPNRPVDQINLYTRDGKRVSSGLNNEVAPDSPEGAPWYKSLAGEDVRQRVFFSGADEALSKYTTDAYGRMFMTLAMENFDNFGNPCGYIEIKQRVSRVVSGIAAYGSGYGERTLFFDADGRLIYPLKADAEGLFEAAQAMGFPEEFRRASAWRGDALICCAPSDGGNFHTVTVIDTGNLLRPVLQQIATAFVITLAVLALAILLSHLAARRITAPIDQMCQQLGSFDLERPTALPPLETDLMEMQTLHGAFTQLQGTLSEHVGKLLELQNQEMQSRMLALQAQMNPHFLYNSLQALQAMADEGMNDEIAVMCQSMADILRYISSDSAQKVPLADELKHTRDYLRCMEIRYQGDLSYEIDVPEALDGVSVPKLCVQLLAENAIKFTTTRRPPYKIAIRGEADGDGYRLKILDNGPGFEEETLAALKAQMDEIRRTRTLPSLKINGMGILHVFIRFCLLYDNQFLFTLENNPEGGACVTIGASIHESEV